MELVWLAFHLGEYPDLGQAQSSLDPPHSRRHKHISTICSLDLMWGYEHLLSVFMKPIP
jgi:hypothetical protein